MRVEDDRIVVLFDEVGYKTLALAAVTEQRPAADARPPAESRDRDQQEPEPASGPRRSARVKVLGINAIYHDPAAALVVDGKVVAAAEEERFSRRKHGKRPLPWSAWELPELSAAWCLAEAGITPEDLDAVAYSFDPALMGTPEETGLFDDGDVMRKMYAEKAPDFLAHALPGPRPGEGPLRHAPRRARRVRRAGRPVRGPTPCSCSTAAARRTATWPAATSTASWRSSPARRCRTRWACCTRTSPTTWASCAAPTSSRSWRWPPTASRASPASWRS